MTKGVRLTSVLCVACLCYLSQREKIELESAITPRLLVKVSTCPITCPLVPC